MIEKENLRDKSIQVGNYLITNLRQLMEKHPIIGDVRGVGLFVGIDLVKDRDSREPATAEAQHIISRMKQEFILLSADGPHRNILKMKPPMVFSEKNADRVIATLDHVLTEMKQNGVSRVIMILLQVIWKYKYDLVDLLKKWLRVKNIIFKSIFNLYSS